MDRQTLISNLDTHFNFHDMPERDWISPLSHSKKYITENFKKHQNGEVFHFTGEINKVFLSTFASESVVKKILDKDTENGMLVVHHPMDWVIEGDGEDRITNFVELPENLILEMKESELSLYSLHIPLDKVGEYSTCFAFSEPFGNKEIMEEIYNFNGVYVGIIGKTEIETRDELKNKFEVIVGHEVALYKYGEDEITEQKVGFVGGGGMKSHVIEELNQYGVNTFCTGITMNTPYNRAAHNLAEKYRINILGGTHYSTEKFALMKLSRLFDRYGISSEFIADKPDMKDIDI